MIYTRLPGRTNVVNLFGMAYNKRGYFRRVRAVQELAAKYYEPGRQDRCYKWVWKKHIAPVYGLGYHTFLKYVNMKIPADTPPADQ